METISKNNWSIHDNRIAIALMRFFVSIELMKGDDDIVIKLNVYNDSKIVLTFIFHSLEDAFSFVQNDIDCCTVIEEIVERYKKRTDDNQWISNSWIEEVVDSKKYTKAVSKSENDNVDN